LSFLLLVEAYKIFPYKRYRTGAENSSICILERVLTERVRQNVAVESEGAMACLQFESVNGELVATPLSSGPSASRLVNFPGQILTKPKIMSDDD
jgi:hypothetical protein